MISITEFKQKYTLEQRQNMSLKIKEKHPNRVPIFVERDQKSTLKDLKKQKFLVPNELSFGGFIGVIRKNIELKHNHALFVFVDGNSLPATNELLAMTYKNHVSEDGFLYCTYLEENTFG